jgi:hypothetical protein
MPTSEFLAYLHTEHDALISGSPNYDYYAYSELIRKETITREWLDSLACGKEYYICVEDETHQWVIRAYEHTTANPTKPLSNIRVYQTIMNDTSHGETIRSDPIASISEVISHINNEYQTVLNTNNLWTDIYVPLSGITREWLEGLAVGSGTRIIGDDNEDVGLSVLVFEMNLV